MHNSLYANTKFPKPPLTHSSMNPFLFTYWNLIKFYALWFSWVNLFLHSNALTDRLDRQKISTEAALRKSFARFVGIRRRREEHTCRGQGSHPVHFSLGTKTETTFNAKSDNMSFRSTCNHNKLDIGLREVFQYVAINRSIIWLFVLIHVLLIKIGRYFKHTDW